MRSIALLSKIPRFPSKLQFDGYFCNKTRDKNAIEYDIN